MLPISATEPAVAERLVAIVCNSVQLMPTITSTLGSTNSQTLNNNELFDVTSISTNIDALLFTSQYAQQDVIEACDGVVFVVSAAEGIAPDMATLWGVCIDSDIPRLLVVTDLFSSYTDFDEVVAIAKRILQPNIEVRYLPMADDDAENMAGIFDLLTGEVWDYTTNVREIRSADEEHTSLTSEDRSELLEGIAVSAFADADLSVHQSGLTLPIERYVDVWNHPHITGATPLENSHGFEIVREWIELLPARWLPESDGIDNQVSVTGDSFSGERFGLGISTGVARMWGPQSADLVIRRSHGLADDSSAVKLTSADVFQACLIDNSIHVGDTIYESDKTLKLRAPVL